MKTSYYKISTFMLLLYYNNLHLQIIPNKYWLRSRIAYDHLSMMARELDQLISFMILQSFSENLIDICMVIIHSDYGTFYSYVMFIKK